MALKLKNSSVYTYIQEKEDMKTPGGAIDFLIDGF